MNITVSPAPAEISTGTVVAFQMTNDESSAYDYSGQKLQVQIIDKESDGVIATEEVTL